MNDGVGVATSLWKLIVCVLAKESELGNENKYSGMRDVWDGYPSLLFSCGFLIAR